MRRKKKERKKEEEKDTYKDLHLFITRKRMDYPRRRRRNMIT